MDLLDKIKAGSGFKKRFKWPGTDIDISIRVLNEGDYLKSTQETDEIFNKSVGLANVEEYQAEKSTQLLFRSCVDPDTGKQIFGNITEFREVLTPEIKQELDKYLDEVHSEIAPKSKELDEKEVDAFYQDIKKNCQETLSSISSIPMLKRLITILVGLQST